MTHDESGTHGTHRPHRPQHRAHRPQRRARRPHRPHRPHPPPSRRCGAICSPRPSPRHRRLPAVRLDRRRRRMPGLVRHPGRTAGAAPRSGPEREPVGLAGRPRRRGRRRHRVPPGLRAGRRCLRRAPRSRLRLRRPRRTAPERTSFSRPLGIVNFGDEEGARFGLACVGSRLTARLARAQAHRLTDGDGTPCPGDGGRRPRPRRHRPRPERLARIGVFVELHVEQGRALDLSGDRVGIASAIWPHGRWRFDFRGEANHAGTTRLADRRDPTPPYAETVLATRREAELAGAVATFGKIAVEPNGVNAIPSLVRGWLDSRAVDQPGLDAVVAAVEKAAREHAVAHGVELDVVRESRTPVVEFDHALRDELARILGRDRTAPVPVLGTGAGHDAGILSGSIPTAMLFVRNPTGVSHSPAEHADEDDCVAGCSPSPTYWKD
ncbi:allantoate amidohydrolase [Streptomyces sp. INA 01156]